MWLLLGFFLLGLISTVIWITAYNTYNNGGSSHAEGWMYFGGIWTVVFGIAFIIVLMALPVTYIESINDIADLEAFRDGVFETYITAVNATEEKAIVRLDLEKLLVSAENIKQSTNLSNRIVELRNRVTWYNETLKRLRIKNNIWWLDGFYKDVPESLLVIKLTGNAFAK